MQYIPDKWVVLKIVYESETLYKVLGHWFGGFTDGDRWRLNSGITRVKADSNFYHFYGHSGSVYVCSKRTYGLTVMTSEIVRKMQSRFPNQVEVLEDRDWNEFSFGDANADIEK